MPKTSKKPVIAAQQLEHVSGGMILHLEPPKNAAAAVAPLPVAVNNAGNANIANVAAVAQPKVLGAQTFNPQLIAAMLGLVAQPQARLATPVLRAPQAVATYSPAMLNAVARQLGNYGQYGPYSGSPYVQYSDGSGRARTSRTRSSSDRGGHRRAARHSSSDDRHSFDRDSRDSDRDGDRFGRDRGRSDRGRDRYARNDPWGRNALNRNDRSRARDDGRGRGPLNPFGGNTYSQHEDAFDRNGNRISTWDGRMYTDNRNQPRLATESYRDRDHQYSSATAFRDGRPIVRLENERDRNGFGIALSQLDANGQARQTLGVDCNNQMQCTSYRTDANGRTQEFNGDQFGLVGHSANELLGQQQRGVWDQLNGNSGARSRDRDAFTGFQNDGGSRDRSFGAPMVGVDTMDGSSSGGSKEIYTADRDMADASGGASDVGSMVDSAAAATDVQSDVA